MHALKWNVLGIEVDNAKPGTSEANVRKSREELTSTDLPMNWTDVMKLIGLVFCTNIPQYLCTDLRVIRLGLIVIMTFYPNSTRRLRHS